jgi:hypothetical protein
LGSLSLQIVFAQGQNPNATLLMQGLAASGGQVNPATVNGLGVNALPNLKTPLPDLPELNLNQLKKTKDEETATKLSTLKANVDIILSYINTTDPSWYEHAGDFDVANSGKYANALKDIINFYRSFVKDDNKNRSIIPTKLSLDMSTEQSVRSSADTSLTSRLSTEESVRSSADASITASLLLMT